jgi:hypothetical protein
VNPFRLLAALTMVLVRRVAGTASWSITMCDYSLEHLTSRPAKIGDKLVSTRFTNSITRGFAAVGNPDVAVCLLPGTELAFENEVKYESFVGVFPKRKTGQRVARFRHINEDRAASHHDALEFPNGESVLVTRLCEGQHATVLQLPVRERVAPTTEQTPKDAFTTDPRSIRCSASRL